MAGLTRRRQAAAKVLERVLRDRRAALGPREGGLYEYYCHKLDHDWLIGDADLKIVEFVKSRRGRFDRVWEIGAGVGQLSLLLAADGVEAFALEIEPRRFGAATAVREAVEKVARGRPLRCA